MIIPFPERIPLLPATMFSLALSIGLVATGTGPIFSVLAFVFVVTATMAFNAGGGMTLPSGNYVFFFSVLSVILGLMVKVFAREPAEAKLHSPITTMSAYTGGILVMLLAVYISRKISRRQGFLQEVVTASNMRLAAVGCVVGGIVIPILAGLVVSSENETLLPLAQASSQFNRFLAMAIILATTYEIKTSGGKRSVNASVYIATVAIWYDGLLLGYSKEAMFTPPLCWLASGAALRYKYTFKQMIGLAMVLLFFGYYMVPYSQYGRNFKDPTLPLTEQLAISIGFLTHLDDLREKYKDDEETQSQTDLAFSFYTRPMGLFDRLQMFGIDDALNTVTNEKGVYGMSPYLTYIASIVPHVLWKNKPAIGIGNQFAHEMGFNEDDNLTGISITPVAEAYHEAKWFGVLVVEPIVWITLFVIMDSLCGDMRKSPWGILVLAMVAHVAPEGGLQGAFYTMTYGAVIVLTVAFVSAYVMPLLASLVTPPKKKLPPVGSVREGSGPAFANAEPAPLRR